MKWESRPYQRAAVNYILSHPSCGLFLDMGLGKTVITLTALDLLINDYLQIGKVLVIAPLRVARHTWPEEAKKWDHLKDLRLQVCCGTEAERKDALSKDADVYVINREQVAWLVKYYGKKWPFDMTVIDELSSFKSPGAQRFRALKKVPGRVIGLTGTPGNLLDLWAEIYLLDKGKRLGRSITVYKNLFFTPGARSGHIVYEWRPKEGAEEEIKKRISDICISMNSEDYVDLPERIDHIVEVELPKPVLATCRQLKKELIAKISDTDEVTAANAAVVSGMLQQMANGAIYMDGEYRVLHNKKIEALGELVEAAQGQPILVFYKFRHDLARIQEAFPEARALDSPESVNDWCAGKVKIGLAHPQSAGHGLNLQSGGHIIVWFGLDWWLEGYEQANKRLHRPGQKQPVQVYHILAKDSIDPHIYAALSHKHATQQAILDGINFSFIEVAEW